MGPSNFGIDRAQAATVGGSKNIRKSRKNFSHIRGMPPQDGRSHRKKRKYASISWPKGMRVGGMVAILQLFAPLRTPRQGGRSFPSPNPLSGQKMRRRFEVPGGKRAGRRESCKYCPRRRMGVRGHEGTVEKTTFDWKCAEAILR